MTALVSVGLGASVLLRGVRVSLRFDPPPPGVAPPELRPALVGAVASDEVLSLGWQTARRMQARPDRARVAADVRAAADLNREHAWVEYLERAYWTPLLLEKLQLASVVLRGAGNAE